MLTLVSVFIVCSGDYSTSYSYPTVVCPSLSLTNGMISYSDPTLGVGSVATHSCDPGYTLNGGNTRSCQSDGSWSGSDPTCEGLILITMLLWLLYPMALPPRQPPLWRQLLELPLGYLTVVARYFKLFIFYSLSSSLLS